jgi:alpha-galactosidase
MKSVMRPGVAVFIATLLCASVSFASSGEILTPKPGPEPKINGPSVYGVRPGRPFLYRIPCTGVRPIQFSATGLPESLSLDPKTGIIKGAAPKNKGEYPITLKAFNSKGVVTRKFTITVGDRIALTPPMGWNDWYTYYDRISDRIVRHAAETMIASGMADFGYQYVNIDDAWMVKPGSSDPELGGEPRDAKGAIRPNRRFPDMKALTDHIHSLGLKAGIYTSPGPLTCADFVGSYQHEAVDARQFADWGFDFLKYDWCSYESIAPPKDVRTVKDYEKPYALMGPLVEKQGRDIVFNLCQYGLGDVWSWVDSARAHSWRTTDDLGLEKATSLPGFYTIGLENAKYAKAAGPGRWNDPDYILIGQIGNANDFNQPAKMTDLTADEQYSYMSMWSLMAAPLFFSGGMDKLDPFTLNILCNSEVIDIDQDPLGRQAKIVLRTTGEFILAKPMADGSLALGLFNLGEKEAKISVDWKQLGLTGKHAVRDVWRQKNIGQAAGQYDAVVKPHGVALVRLTANSN